MRLPSECGVRIIKTNYNFHGPYPKRIPSDITSYTQSGIEHPDDPLCVQHLKHLTKLGIDIDEVSTGYLGNIGCLLLWLYKRTPTLFEISGSIIHRMPTSSTRTCINLPFSTTEKHHVTSVTSNLMCTT